jgi:hypothetical protein
MFLETATGMKGDATTLGDANRTPEGRDTIRVLAVDSSEGILALYRDAVQGCTTESGSGLCFELHCTRNSDDALKAVEGADL